ncbi:papain-like cysteine protease family protein [Mucilaginibacter angelicae]|uniref:Papain-like cysteine protease family protein n=1 Tax=Mucilaginibacter angelicae TaxID=869718 RepID=A0ABV6L936_9SPHI
MANRQLTFRIQCQEQDQWCWAAVANSVSHFYTVPSAWTQCTVASTCLNRQDCCNDPAGCNQPWYLDRALQTTQNFRAPVQAGTLTPQAIQTEIDAGRVIGVRIGWNPSGGHFVTIYGYNDTPGTFYVYVGDPWYPNSMINLANFNTAYQGNGRCTNTYLTDPPAGGGMIQFSSIQQQLAEKAVDFKKSLAPETKTNRLALARPHDVYIIDLISLEERRIRLKKGGHRLIDTTDGDSQMIYDFSDEGTSAVLQQVIHSQSYTKHYNKQIDRLEEQFEKSSVPFELRIVRQPQLKVEALWLHRNGKTYLDRFIPITDSRDLKEGVLYSRFRFFRVLFARAAEYQKYDDELLGG